jgi:hypothetical protein
MGGVLVRLIYIKATKKGTFMKQFIRKFLVVLSLLILPWSTLRQATAYDSEGSFHDTAPLYQEGSFETATVKPSRVRGADTAFQLAQARILDGLTTLSNEIDVSEYNIPVENRLSLYAGVVNANPQLFYVTGKFTTNYTGTLIISIVPEYTGTANEIDTQKVKFNTAVSEAINSIPTGLSEAEQVLAVNDWMVVYAEYDTNYERYDAYDLLVEKTAVCQGYALAFGVLMNELGLEWRFVSSESMNHAWDLVKVDDSWYHIDVTWNDPIPNTLGSVSHKYLLRSNTSLEAHTSWETSTVEATSGTYDTAFWRGVSSQIIPLDGKWYYTASSSGSSHSIVEYDYTTETQQSIAGINTKWSAGDNRYWLHSPCLAERNGVLYYNTANKIYSLKPDGTDLAEVCTVEKLSGTEAIYGFDIIGQYLRYQVKTEPSAAISSIEKFPLNAGAFILGDVDGNGTVDGRDVTYLARYLAEWSGYSLAIEAAADVDKNNAIDGRDVTYLARYLAEWSGYSLE